ncbi:MAG TPA: ABC transporter ATP-binding protein [Opitutaceae bacterium]|nr:ABC transporter ATP-binding protein [Opitutaceae bacterium]
MSFLELRGVSKSYGSGPARTEILHDLDLSVDEGEFVAVVGYSGSGKTTLINLVAGLVRPDYGEVLLDGRPITGPGPDRGMIFQNYSLLPWLTVSANIALAVESCFPEWSAAKRRGHVAQHIEMVGLTPHAHKLPRQLSGGQRQRVAVARGLAMDPRILLLDEPLGALDALTRGSLQEEIARIWQATRKTVLLITNDVDEALLLADRVIPLSTGPSATLGEPVPVPLARPRDRKALNHDPEFKHLRALIMRQLLAFGARRTTTVSRKLVLPDLLPEDLSRGRPLLALGARPRRRHEEKREDVTLAT